MAHPRRDPEGLRLDALGHDRRAAARHGLAHAPLRHANNLESERTDKGTDDVHTLVPGNPITATPAFR